MRLISAFVGVVAWLALATLFPGMARAAGEVALTYDDLTTLSLSPSTEYAEATTIKLLAGLRHHHLVATGFVNEGKLEGADRAERIGLLRRWVQAGVLLGNHTYSHNHFSLTPVDAYIADIERGEPVTRALLAEKHEALRWFRHPYLETGATLEARDKLDHWLTEHGYRVAPVTMENADWMFAIPYDSAVMRGDKKRAKAIKAAYLEYTDFVTGWYESASVAVFGRKIRFVYLLHSCRLNADSVHEFAKILRQHALVTVSLDRATADPAYNTPDTYVGPDGNEWLERWSISLHKELPWDTFKEPPKLIEAENNRLDR